MNDHTGQRHLGETIRKRVFLAKADGVFHRHPGGDLGA
jgi:hypothetical protein